jgi:hypothetical protein
MVTRAATGPRDRADVFRIRPGLAVVPCDEGVLFAAGTWGRRIGGADARRLLLPVARLLDGTRTVDEVASVTGIEPSVAAELAEQLWSGGFAEQAARGAVAEAPDAVTAYLGKVAGSGGAGRSGAPGNAADTRRLLASARAIVLAPSAVSERVAADLSRTGVADVGTDPHARHAPDHAPSADHVPSAAGATLALVHDDGSDAVARLINGLVTGGEGTPPSPVLRFRISAAGIEIGPLYAPGYLSGLQTCHACVRAGSLALWPAGPGSDDACGVAEVGCAMVAGEALAFLAGIGNGRVRSYHTLSQLSWPDLTTSRFIPLPEPGCPACARHSCRTARTGWPAVPGTADQIYLPAAYEHQLQAELDSLRTPAPASKRRTQRYAQLERARTPYPSSPRLALPAKGEPGYTASDRLGALSRLLLSGTAGRPDRTGSTELYILSGTSLGDRPPGTVLKYDDLAHQLVTVHDRSIPLDAIFPGPAGQQAVPWTAGNGQPDLAIVLVSATGRMSGQYGPAAPRQGYLDAGCALAQVSALAGVEGIQVTVSTCWSEELPAALELNGESETIAAVAWISGWRNARAGTS